MSNNSICRIGVFYDGSYFSIARRHYYHQRKLGWLTFQPFHAFIEDYMQQTEPGYFSYKVVYAAWFQGLFTSKKASEEQLRFDRNLYHDLMHAGIEPKYAPMSQADREKGIDVSMAVDALQTGLDGKFDIAALVTGDGDFVPLVRALMKQGIRVIAVYFAYEESSGKKCFVNERLLSACNYVVDINNLEKSKEFKTTFAGLYRQR